MLVGTVIDNDTGAGLAFVGLTKADVKQGLASDKLSVIKLLEPVSEIIFWFDETNDAIREKLDENIGLENIKFIPDLITPP